MSFLVVLGCLGLERLLSRYQYLRHPIWLASWLGWHQSRPLPKSWRNGSLGLVGLLVPPLLLVGLAQGLLTELAMGLPGGLFAALVLLYSLGPEDLYTQVAELRTALEAGDRERLERVATRLMDDIPPSFQDPRFLHTLTETVLIQAHGRYFAVLMWFLLLGPVGALGYRLVAEIRRLTLVQVRGGLASVTQRLLYVLDWPPAQVIAILFALAGCFEPALQGWRNCAPDRRHGDAGKAAVLCAGRGALQLDQAVIVEALGRPLHPFLPGLAMDLVQRALVLFVVVLGTLTLVAGCP